MRVVVAIGGNALLERGETPDAETQRTRLAAVAPALRALAAEHQLVLVHGNGPQVGMLAVESESDASLSRPYPLADLVAESQGLIGSWLQQELAPAGPVVTLVTHVVVDERDPAFAAPSKFVGVTYDDDLGHRLARDHGWTMRRDGPAWRRVVASPRPVEVVELSVAAALLEAGVTVVMAGGGGVPVTRGDGGLRTADAVIDKDDAAALVADRLGADLLAILTDVDGVMTDFGGPDETLLHQATPAELDQMQLPAGSMGPKVTAATAFVRGGANRRAAVGALARAEHVVAGQAGTQIR